MRLLTIVAAALAFAGLSAMPPAAAETTSLRSVVPAAPQIAAAPSAEQYRYRHRYGYRPGYRAAWRHRYYRPGYRYAWRRSYHRPAYRYGYRYRRWR